MVGNLDQEPAEPVGLLLVQSGPRLIQQDDLRLADQRLADLDHAAFEKIEPTAENVAPVAEADEIQRQVDLPASAGAVARDVVGDGLDIFHCRQFVDDELLLKRAAQPHAHPAARRQAEQRGVVEQNRAFDRRDEAGKHVEQRRLARAVGADQPANRRGEFGVKLVERLDAAKAHAQPVDLDHDARFPWNCW